MYLLHLFSAAATLLLSAVLSASSPQTPPPSSPMPQRQPQVSPSQTYPSTPSLDNYFSKSSSVTTVPDGDGFIRRWLLLEPIDKPNRGNTVFVDSYVRETLSEASFAGGLARVPRAGEVVKVGDQTLRWHSLDSKLFNVKLFRFATGLKLQHYGIICQAVTVIECDQDMTDIRLSVGSNSASRWWLNGEEALLLSGDRRMEVDDCVSKRLTLHKGRNILAGAVINGPGMSDFCVRFLDDAGKPVRNITISNK